jgi:hypothetical protein
LLGVVACLALAALPVVAKADTPEERIKKLGLAEVGDTKDACGAAIVSFSGREMGEGKIGEVRVGKGEKKLVELPAVVTEFHWYCDGVRERVANGKPFDWVLIERAGNGAIAWKFYRKP